MDSLARKSILASVGFTTQDGSGNGLLQIAALQGHLEILGDLLMRGFNINAVDRNHGTALQAAIYMGQVDVWRRLLDWSPETESFVLRDKIDINTQGGYFGCALQVAAYKAEDVLVQELVQRGADVNTTGGKYGCSLQAAVRTGRMAVVVHILPGAVVNLKVGKYDTALQAVARGARRQRVPLPEISRGVPLKLPARDRLGIRVDHKEANDVNYIEVANALFWKGAQMVSRSVMNISLIFWHSSTLSQILDMWY